MEIGPEGGSLTFQAVNLHLNVVTNSVTARRQLALGDNFLLRQSVRTVPAAAGALAVSESRFGLSGEMRQSPQTHIEPLH